MNESSAHELHVPADDLPVPAGPATVPHDARPRQGPGRLVLCHPFLIPISAAFVTGGMTGILAMHFFVGVGPVAWLFIGLFMIVTAWNGLYRPYLLPRITFDRESGLLKLGWLGLRGRRPLSSVIGIQVMPTRSQLDIPENNATAQETYQLNLILDDSAERRLNVMTCSSPFPARSNARLIADLLGVPIHDCADTPKWAAVAAAIKDLEARAAEPNPIHFIPAESPVVTEHGSDVLIIRKSRLTYLIPPGFGGRWLAGMGLLWVASIILLFSQMDWFLAAIMGIAVTALTLSPLLLNEIFGFNAHSRARFDRERGTLTLGRSAARPLRCVTAVEVTVGPVCHRAHNFLNLLLDDPHHPRLTLISHADTALVQRAAERVASFLGVSIQDSADSPESAAAAEPNPIFYIPPESPVVTKHGPNLLIIRNSRLAFLREHSAPLLVTVVSSWVAFVLLMFSQMDSFLTAIVGFSAIWTTFSLLLDVISGLKPDSRARFDREQGTLVLGRSAPRPLSCLSAVEIAAEPKHHRNCLMLLLDAPHCPRVTLIRDADAVLVRRAAEEVASFLGVPLHDTKRQMPASGPSGAEGAVNPLDQLDRSALPPGIASIRGPARVVPKGDDVLVLGPRALFTWVDLALAMFVTGLGALLFLVWLRQGPVALALWWDKAVVLMIVALVKIAVSKRRLLYRDHFDRQAGQLTLGWFGRKRSYPLAEVLAVQLVPGGLIENNQRLIYQLNLVMADPFLDRLNLTNDSDLEWTRQAGRQVADFLGVAMIDQIADGG
jgi:hypothetical protein